MELWRLLFFTFLSEALHQIDGSPDFELDLKRSSDKKPTRSSFVLVSKLGAGLCGVVHAATITTEGNKAATEVAVKTVVKGEADYDEACASLAREIMVYESIGNAPGFPTFYGSGTSYSKMFHGQVVVVLEKFEMSLEKYIENNLSWNDWDRRMFSLEFLIAAIKILQVPHEKGIVHRDLKLDNFVVRIISADSVELAVVDFGHTQLPKDPPSKVRGNWVFSPLARHLIPEDAQVVASPRNDLEGLLYLCNYIIDLDVGIQQQAAKVAFSKTIEDKFGAHSPVTLALINVLTEVRKSRYSDKTPVQEPTFKYAAHIKEIQEASETFAKKRPSGDASYKFGTIKISKPHAPAKPSK